MLKGRKMETKDLHRLIKGHKQIADKIKAKEAALKEELQPEKEKLAKVQSKLQTIIHKDNEEGLAKVTLPDGSVTAYARYEDKYKIRDRDELIDDFILEGIPAKYAKMVKAKLDIFGNTLVKDPCIEHRVDTGAEEENGRMIGGALPPGVGLYVHKDVRLIKGK